MSDEPFEPTNAQTLAALITRRGESGYVGATVQRSHRFPMHIITQIENMAEMASSPISLIINELLQCGLDAVKKELPEEVVKRISLMSEEQIKRPTKSVRLESAPMKSK